ncbi:ribonuclease H [Phenylobacterium sp.]|jgi:ribonuclease HI|uniref:ribonuclease H n=1 Tax=Phenylobacterium sp. TaxID=1871053 RepID=UPI0037845DB1
MTSPPRIWLAAAHHRAFLNGGWAFVAAGAETSGQAGGERRTDRAAMVRSGLLAALDWAPMGAATLHLLEADASTLAEVLADAAVRKALAGRELRLVRAAKADGTPLAFAEAWADLAAERAKAKGPFRAPIPKPNLAKVAGL